MEWLGYTNQHLWGNICIILILTLVWTYNKIPLDPKPRHSILVLLLIIGIALTGFWAITLRDNPHLVYKIF